MRFISYAVLAACLLPVVSAAHAQTIQVSKDNRTLAVTATDTASAFADVAVLTIGFEAYGADEQSAYAAGSERSNAIVSALTGAGVANDKIESQNQQIAPLNDYELKNQPAALKGARVRVTQSWTVRTAPENAAHLLDVAVKAGANQSGNIDWQMADPDALQAQAAAKALAHAQSIAQTMAAGLHARVGSLLYASNQAQIERPGPVMLARAMAPAAQGKAAPLAISNRKVAQSATVYAVFQIE